MSNPANADLEKLAREEAMAGGKHESEQRSMNPMQEPRATYWQPSLS
jgi:hypothetical protein